LRLSHVDLICAILQCEPLDDFEADSMSGATQTIRYSAGDEIVENYILGRLNAAHLLARADHESQLQHQGIKGRFRELLINDILTPWLPPYILCGTGIVIAAENKVRQFTQDDIIVYDRSLVPPVLAAVNHASEGVFL
jgi:hypothetical protein